MRLNNGLVRGRELLPLCRKSELFSAGPPNFNKGVNNLEQNNHSHKGAQRLIRLLFRQMKANVRQGKGTGKEAWVCVSPYTGATVLGYQVQQKVIDKLRKRGYHAMDYTATWIRISW